MVGGIRGCTVDALSLHNLERSLSMPPGLQIFNVNYALARKLFKPIIVCDISPNIAVQVINVEGINEQELLGSMRALSAWDMSNALSEKQLGKTK
jgi:hypothetical protein